MSADLSPAECGINSQLATQMPLFPMFLNDNFALLSALLEEFEHAELLFYTSALGCSRPCFSIDASLVFQKMRVLSESLAVFLFSQPGHFSLNDISLLSGKISTVVLVLILNSTSFTLSPPSLYHDWPKADYWRFMQHNVVVLRCEEARKAYFENKDIRPAQGYKVLQGGVYLVTSESYHWQ